MTEKDALIREAEHLIDAIPVVTTHTPLNWDYDILGLVTGQSVTGTGVVSEISSSITDFFGMQSIRYNNKLKVGEKLCLAQLRKQTVDWGGNAIIATDIDYSELGGLKGMIMVCIAGTAVRLKNTDVLGETKNEQIKNLVALLEKLKPLAEFNYHEV
ncbi:MAG TPA: heavy metal-binding domain-containing protein [Chitinophagaceae bacterium]|nr:heavy metal-binding domain-containing protein [Chitinophagaceae bacterium]